MSDEDAPRNINFDFSTVLPEAVISQQWNQPYDRDWVNLNIALRKQAEFNCAGTSKLKLVDLMRGGVLEVGDSFEVGVITTHGQTIYRFPDLVGRVLSGRNVGCPIIRMPSSLATDPPAADYIVKGPVEIVRHTLAHYGYQQAAINPRREGWQSVLVWDGPRVLDSLHDLRQAYALWRGTVDWYTTTHDLEGRRRRIDPRTGEYVEHPALTVRSRHNPNNGSLRPSQKTPKNGFSYGRPAQSA
ncbi:MAG: hypothetical protein Q9184_004841 [Pyrenodesmia sp. 2 TL-2023]